MNQLVTRGCSRKFEVGFVYVVDERPDNLLEINLKCSKNDIPEEIVRELIQLGAQGGMTEHNKNVVKIQFFPTSKSFDCKIKTISKKRVENHEF